MPLDLLNKLNLFSNTPFIWPEAKPMDLDHSYVWTFDKNMKYYPVGEETNTDTIGWVFLVFLALWSVLFYWRIVYHKKTIIPLLIGFFTGIILFYSKHILYGSLINVLHPVRNPKPGIQLINSPNIIDFNQANNANKTLKEHIDYSPGDYKILIENKVFPKDEQVGYIMSARTYLEYEKSKNIDGMNLATFLEKYSCPTCDGYNQDTQHQAIDFPEKLGNVETLVFYLGILILTFAIYISDVNTKFFKIKNNKIFVFWVILVLIITTITPGFGVGLPGLQNISSLENIIDFKENLAIIAISFAITTVLIV